MPLPRKELNQIEENHQVRPYLIAQKDIKNYEVISINSKMYYVSFKEMTSFKRIAKMDIVDIGYKSEKEVILERKFLYKKALKKQKK